jgi:cytochrome c oxidase subunit 2
VQSALDVGGEGAERIAVLFWMFSAICAAVWALVMLALAWAALRRQRVMQENPLEPQPAAERWATGAVAGAIALTALTLIFLVASSYFTGKSLAGLGGPEALTIRVTGHQWWWEIRYEDPQPSRTLITANEIHVPIGRPVRVKLQSTDVIHSFWVPSLAGKTDNIPGRETELRILAERAGTYRGQCAEFCGLQHAHMGVLVVAEPQSDYDAWYEGQLGAAREPANEAARRGKELFLSRACVMCHTIRGTPAGGKVAPELTHIGSQRTIAAGTLPLSRENLIAWMLNPQAIKPGTNMPRVPLHLAELRAIASYLEGLK